MEYIFRPFRLRSIKRDRAKFDLEFNFKTYHGCMGTYGIHVELYISFLGKGINLHLCPIGEFKKSCH